MAVAPTNSKGVAVRVNGTHAARFSSARCAERPISATTETFKVRYYLSLDDSITTSDIAIAIGEVNLTMNPFGQWVDLLASDPALRDRNERRHAQRFQIESIAP